ncbi:MAG: hypothetical protein LBG43_10055 [Treponema sp.]|nr:hypothetical protein [Treponema sp.]
MPLDHRPGEPRFRQRRPYNRRGKNISLKAAAIDPASACAAVEDAINFYATGMTDAGVPAACTDARPPSVAEVTSVKGALSGSLKARNLPELPCGNQAPDARKRNGVMQWRRRGTPFRGPPRRPVRAT